MNNIIMLGIVLLYSLGVIFLTIRISSKTYRFVEERHLRSGFLRKAMASAVVSFSRGVIFFRNSRKEEIIGKEIYTALSVLRNHASAAEGAMTGGSAAVTTDYILEQFSQTEGVLAKYYSGALRLLRTGRRSQAIEYFASSADVELARDFIMLVLDWDSVPPYKFKKTVGAFQNALKETRTTRLIRKNEALSDLVYLPVVACVLVIFVNFIYVAYFAEQRALLAELFF